MRTVGPLEGRLAARLHPVRTHLPAGQSRVALTFDDGPDPEWTPRFLDLLGAAGARATFFLVGERARQHRGIVARILDEGHAVGSHTMRHEQLLELAPHDLRTAVLGGAAAVGEAVGGPVPDFRPPRGHYPLGVSRMARRHRLVVWLWSVETGDWRPETTADDVLERCAGLQDGDIVLMHDALAGDDAPAGSQDRGATLAALPRLLDLAAARGLTCVALPAPHASPPGPS